MKKRMTDGLKQGLKEALEIENTYPAMTALATNPDGTIIGSCILLDCIKQPFILESDNTVFVDIDDTIVKWGASNVEKESKGVVFNNYGYEQVLVPHSVHIEAVKLNKARGHKVIFWSAGGWEWAKEVVTTLGLLEYADAILSKPKWIYDDLPASSFIPESCRIWKKDSPPDDIKENNADLSLDEMEDKYIP